MTFVFVRKAEALLKVKVPLIPLIGHCSATAGLLPRLPASRR